MKAQSRRGIVGKRQRTGVKNTAIVTRKRRMPFTGRHCAKIIELNYSHVGPVSGLFEGNRKGEKRFDEEKKPSDSGKRPSQQQLKRAEGTGSRSRAVDAHDFIKEGRL